MMELAKEGDLFIYLEAGCLWVYPPPPPQSERYSKKGDILLIFGLILLFWVTTR